MTSAHQIGEAASSVSSVSGSFCRLPPFLVSRRPAVGHYVPNALAFYFFFIFFFQLTEKSIGFVWKYRNLSATPRAHLSALYLTVTIQSLAVITRPSVRFSTPAFGVGTESHIGKAQAATCRATRAHAMFAAVSPSQAPFRPIERDQIKFPNSIASGHCIE